MSKEEKKYNTAEKVGFGLGLLVSVVLIGYLIFQISRNKKDPPQLQITSSYKAELKPYTFRVKVENTGEETAKSVNLQLNLFQNGKSAESATMNIDYVPVNSSEIGWVVFTNEPKPGDSLVVSSMTYIKP